MGHRALPKMKQRPGTGAVRLLILDSVIAAGRDAADVRREHRRRERRVVLHDQVVPDAVLQG